MTRRADTGTQPPRIAIVTGQLSQGGAERQLTLLARELQRRHEFIPVVFCMSDATEPYGSALSAAGVEWHAPPAGARSRLRRELWLVRELSKSRYSLVYGVLNAGNVYGGAAAMVSGLPFVGSIRNTQSNLPTVLRLLSGFFCKRARVVVANSDSCAVSLRNYLGVKHERVQVIPNAVMLPSANFDARSRLRNEWGIPENAYLVGTVANLKPQKRVRFFVQTASAMQQVGNTSCHFVWVGDGPERNTLEKDWAQLPPSLKYKIHFPGARLDISDCLAAFDIFVLTSAYEGMPNALLEAMAAGLPCVATNVPGTTDVLQPQSVGEIGLLVDANNPKRFAEVLLDVLHDKQKMRRLSSNAQRHAQEQYGVQTMVNRFCTVFHTAIQKSEQ